MKITTLEELILKFNSELTKIPDSNKLIFIDNEIKEIDSLLKSKRAVKDRMDPYGFLTPIPMRVFDIRINPNYIQQFSNAFNDYYFYEKLVDIETIQNSDSKDIIFQAYEFVKYYKWLKQQIMESSAKTQQKKSGLSHKQKMLALHYLGLDLNKFENTNSAKILSQILDLDYDNTRKYLSYLATGKNEVRTKKNLEILVNIFDIQGFENITNTIKKDIEKF